MRITGRLLLCLVPGLIPSCVSVHHAASSRAAELHEKHLGGDLYRAGRHIHHHPEWTKSPSVAETDEKE